MWEDNKDVIHWMNVKRVFGIILRYYVWQFKVNRHAHFWELLKTDRKGHLKKEKPGKVLFIVKMCPPKKPKKNPGTDLQYKFSKILS